jgi:hypothetical protein
MMGMRWSMAAVVVLPLAWAVAQSAADKEEAKGEKADYKVYNSYFVSNTAGLKGESSYLAFADQKSFDKIFRPAPPNIGQKRDYLPRNAFESKIVIAVVKQGNKFCEYKVEKATVDKDTLYVLYATTSRDTPSTTYACPLIVAVDKGKIASVVFLEDGKKASTAKLDK